MGVPTKLLLLGLTVAVAAAPVNTTGTVEADELAHVSQSTSSVEDSALLERAVDAPRQLPELAEDFNRLARRVRLQVLVRTEIAEGRRLAVSPLRTMPVDPAVKTPAVKTPAVKTPAVKAPVPVPPAPVAAPPPPPPAPVRAAPAKPAAPAVPRHEAVGRQALDQIKYPYEQLGWNITFHPGRRGYYGMAKLDSKTIEIYVRDNQGPDEVSWVLAHELGHAVDWTLMDWDKRAAYRDIRGFPQDMLWYGCERCTDFETPAGDFAEVFAQWVTGPHPFKSKMGPAPTRSQIDQLRALVQN